MNKIILFIAVLSYAFVVSQSFMYILALKNTQLALGGNSYVEVRQLIDANMKSSFSYVVYITLLSSFLLVILNFKAPSGILFITSAIAFAAMLVDVLLMLKGSMPLNTIINTWSPENYPQNWKDVRTAWFEVFQYRQITNITGFLSLLAGTIFANRV